MLARATLGFLFLLSLLNPASSLGQDDYALALGTAESTVGGQVSVELTLDAAADFDGFHFGVCHDTGGLVLDLVLAGDYLEDNDPEFHNVVQSSDGFTACALADVDAGESFPATSDGEVVYSVRYDVRDEGEFDVEFCETLGDPIVTVAVVVDAEDMEVATTNGRVAAVLAEFLRGDVDSNGRVEPLTDARFLICSAFAGGEQPECRDAADVDDDGTVVTIIDALFLLDWAFTGDSIPADPGPFDCGTDPDGSDAGCAQAPDCDGLLIPDDEPDPDYLLTLTGEGGVTGTTETVRVLLDSSAGDEISGMQFSVCHDDRVELDPDGVIPGSALSDFSEMVNEVVITDEGWRVGIIPSVIFVEFLAPEEAHEIYTATYELTEAGDSELTFCTIGSVVEDEFPVYAWIDTEESGVIPTTEPVSISIYDPLFLRGDVNGDGVYFAIIDALFLLEWGFSGGPEPPCLDAADADDDGELFPIVDALRILNFGHIGGPPPADPGPEECGEDPTEDTLDCLDVVENCR